MIWLWMLWAGVIQYFSRDFDAAMLTYQQLFRLRPSYTQGQVFYAMCLGHLGRLNEARELLKRARMQPQDPGYQSPPWVRPEDNALRLEGVRLAETPE